jgi:hypothetical protein
MPKRKRMAAITEFGLPSAKLFWAFSPLAQNQQRKFPSVYDVVGVTLTE